MQYYTYIIYSEKLDNYYIGSTGNLQDRLNKHNRSQKGFTSKGKSWILVYFEAYDSKEKTIAREKQLKNWKNRERLESLIKRNKE